MTADRRVTRTSIAGQNMLNELDDEVVSLNNRSICKLTIVGGTADALQCTVSPPLDPSSPSFVDGMRFEITPDDPSTSSSLTIEIVDDSSPPSTVVAATDVVDRDGVAIPAGEWVADRTMILTYDGTNDRLKVVTNIEPTPEAAIPQPSFRNVVVNGGMEIWQRGAGDSASIAVGASATAYTADRWYLSTNANQASVVSAQNGLASRSRKSARVARNSGQTGTGALAFAYPLTTEECVRLRGDKISLQFLAMAGANFSPSSGTLSYNVYFGTGSEGRRGAGFTGETNPLSGSVNLTADGTTISTVTATSSGTVATNVTQGEVRFSWTPTGTAGANDWVQLDNVQLESGADATAFEYAPFNYMLSECQRHFCKTFTYNTAPAQANGGANILSTAALGDTSASVRMANWEWRFPRAMRTVPTITTYHPSAAVANAKNITTGGATGIGVTVNPAGDGGSERVYITNTTGVLGTSSLGDQIGIHVSADAGL